jgi:phosphoesterase RecJ-like protein
MIDQAIERIKAANHVVIIQAENPDGDSLGSALALEAILGDQAKTTTLFCAIDIPKYLRYLTGWDRVTNAFPYQADCAIIVDTAAEALLVKTLETPAVRNFLDTHPVLVLDHHGEDESKASNDLPFEHTFVMSADAAATGELIYQLATDAGWQISPDAANTLYASIAADTLGMTTESATSKTFAAVAELVNLGAKPFAVELARRELMKKAPEILAYKGQLISRIEYLLDGKLAIVHIPFAEIEEYSDKYNPSVLVLDEMRLVEGVELACAIKTYPDGKLTGKLRGNSPIAASVAGFFGGGGHSYAAGFKVFESYETVIKELVEATSKSLEKTS